jgi:hypothetical protein
MSEAGYAIHYQPLYSALQTMDVQDIIDTTTDPWYNQTLCQVGDVPCRPACGIGRSSRSAAR